MVKFAVVFPGQGAQQPGMGRDLVEGSQAASRVFDQASEATGIDLRTLCWHTDEETLRRTENAQLALFTCGLGAYEALKEGLPGFSPDGFAGHSVGEYAALVAAGKVSLADGARLVRRRGELMAGSGKTRPGTMAAVLGVDADSLEQVCRDVAERGVVVVANDNCPGQLVMSGDVDGVQAAVALAQDRGARKIMPLNVSGAFHSPLMAPAAEELGRALREAGWSTNDARVYSNVTTEPGEDWAALLEQQLQAPVKWRGLVGNMLRDGIDTFVECGVGEVLSGLLRRIDKSATGLKVVDRATLAEALAKLGS